MEHVRGFCPAVPIHINKLDPFKAAIEGNFWGDQGASTQRAED